MAVSRNFSIDVIVCFLHERIETINALVLVWSEKVYKATVEWVPLLGGPLCICVWDFMVHYVAMACADTG